jgi:hypothetical protein
MPDGSDGWCAAQLWLDWIAFDAADLPGALQRSAAILDLIGDREPSRMLADCLGLQSFILSNLGRVPEAAGSARRALAMAASAATILTRTQAEHTGPSRPRRAARSG